LEEVAPKAPPVLIKPDEDEEEEEVLVPLPPGVKPVTTVYDQINKEVGGAAAQAPVPPTPAPPVVPQPEPVAEAKPLVKLDADDEEEKPEPIVNIGGKKDKPSPLKGNIPLHLKFKFQNELFNGNSEAFAEAIEAIDQCATYPEAMAVIRDQYIRKFGWNVNGSATIEFLHLVDNKY
jgi:hypothetical protein